MSPELSTHCVYASITVPPLGVYTGPPPKFAMSMPLAAFPVSCDVAAGLLQNFPVFGPCFITPLAGHLQSPTQAVNLHWGSLGVCSQSTEGPPGPPPPIER